MLPGRFAQGKRGNRLANIALVSIVVFDCVPAPLSPGPRAGRGGRSGKLELQGVKNILHEVVFKADANELHAGYAEDTVVVVCTDLLDVRLRLSRLLCRHESVAVLELEGVVNDDTQEG